MQQKQPFKTVNLVYRENQKNFLELLKSTIGTTTGHYHIDLSGNPIPEEQLTIILKEIKNNLEKTQSKLIKFNLCNIGKISLGAFPTFDAILSMSKNHLTSLNLRKVKLIEHQVDNTLSKIIHAGKLKSLALPSLQDSPNNINSLKIALECNPGLEELILSIEPDEQILKIFNQYLLNNSARLKSLTLECEEKFRPTLAKMITPGIKNHSTLQVVSLGNFPSYEFFETDVTEKLTANLRNARGASSNLPVATATSFDMLFIDQGEEGVFRLIDQILHTKRKQGLYLDHSIYLQSKHVKKILETLIIRSTYPNHDKLHQIVISDIELTEDLQNQFANFFESYSRALTSLSILTPIKASAGTDGFIINLFKLVNLTALNISGLVLDSSNLHSLQLAIKKITTLTDLSICIDDSNPKDEDKIINNLSNLLSSRQSLTTITIYNLTRMSTLHKIEDLVKTLGNHNLKLEFVGDISRQSPDYLSTKPVDATTMATLSQKVSQLQVATPIHTPIIDLIYRDNPSNFLQLLNSTIGSKHGHYDIDLSGKSIPDQELAAILTAIKNGLEKTQSKIIKFNLCNIGEISFETFPTFQAILTTIKNDLTHLNLRKVKLSQYQVMSVLQLMQGGNLKSFALPSLRILIDTIYQLKMTLKTNPGLEELTVPHKPDEQVLKIFNEYLLNDSVGLKSLTIECEEESRPTIAKMITPGIKNHPTLQVVSLGYFPSYDLFETSVTEKLAANLRNARGASSNLPVATATSFDMLFIDKGEQAIYSVISTIYTTYRKQGLYLDHSIYLQSQHFKTILQTLISRRTHINHDKLHQIVVSNIELTKDLETIFGEFFEKYSTSLESLSILPPLKATSDLVNFITLFIKLVNLTALDISGLVLDDYNFEFLYLAVKNMTALADLSICIDDSNPQNEKKIVDTLFKLLNSKLKHSLTTITIYNLTRMSTLHKIEAVVKNLENRNLKLEFVGNVSRQSPDYLNTRPVDATAVATTNQNVSPLTSLSPSSANAASVNVTSNSISGSDNNNSNASASVQRHQAVTQLLNTEVPNLNRDELHFEKTEDHLLGSGTYGKVYAGLWQKDKDTVQVAIKEISSTEDTKLISREINVMYQHSNHPNIATLYGIIQNPSFLIVMQKMDMDLYTFDRSGEYQQFDYDKIITLMLEIAKGMDYLHSKGVIHRDLKTRNILVKRDSGNPTGFILQITDFGLAKDTVNTVHTMTNATMGSIGYMSYEIMPKTTKDKPSYSIKSDMFAMGVIQLEMVDYSQLESDDIMAFQGSINRAGKQKNDKWITIPEKTQETAPKLAHLIKRNLSWNPDTRCDSAENIKQLQDALDEVKPTNNAELEDLDLSTDLMGADGNTVRIGNQN